MSSNQSYRSSEKGANTAEDGEVSWEELGLEPVLKGWVRLLSRVLETWKACLSSLLHRMNYFILSELIPSM